MRNAACPRPFAAAYLDALQVAGSMAVELGDGNEAEGDEDEEEQEDGGAESDDEDSAQQLERALDEAGQLLGDLVVHLRTGFRGFRGAIRAEPLCGPAARFKGLKGAHTRNIVQIIRGQSSLLWLC